MLFIVGLSIHIKVFSRGLRLCFYIGLSFVHECIYILYIIPMITLSTNNSLSCSGHVLGFLFPRGISLLGPLKLTVVYISVPLSVEWVLSPLKWYYYNYMYFIT